MKINSICILCTMRCNMNCWYCFNKIKAFRGKDMNREKFYKCVNNATDVLGVNRVVISGGEPILCRDFPTFLKICEDFNVDLDLFTNGLQIFDAVELLNKCVCLKKIYLSWNALVINPTNQIFMKQLKTTLKLRRMLREDIFIKVQFIVSSETIKFLDRIIDLNLPKISFAVQLLVPSKLTKELDIFFKTIKKWSKKEKKHLYVRLMKTFYLNGEIPIKSRKFCKGSYFPVIDPSGFLYPCMFWDRSIGNVFSEDKKPFLHLQEFNILTGELQCFKEECLTINK